MRAFGGSGLTKGERSAPVRENGPPFLNPLPHNAIYPKLTSKLLDA